MILNFDDSNNAPPETISSLSDIEESVLKLTGYFIDGKIPINHFFASIEKYDFASLGPTAAESLVDALWFWGTQVRELHSYGGYS